MIPARRRLGAACRGAPRIDMSAFRARRRDCTTQIIAAPDALPTSSPPRPPHQWIHDRITCDECQRRKHQEVVHQQRSRNARRVTARNEHAPGEPVTHAHPAQFRIEPPVPAEVLREPLNKYPAVAVPYEAQQPAVLPGVPGGKARVSVRAHRRDRHCRRPQTRGHHQADHQARCEQLSKHGEVPLERPALCRMRRLIHEIRPELRNVPFFDVLDPCGDFRPVAELPAQLQVLEHRLLATLLQQFEGQAHVRAE